LVLIGCGGQGVNNASGGGGGNGGGNGGGGNGGGGGTKLSSVTLPTSGGVLSVTLLSGQGRAVGDVTAVINHLSVAGPGVYLDNPSASPLNIGLNAYTNNQYTIDVPISAIQNNQSFNTFNFEVDAANVENADGSFDTFVQQGVNNTNPPTVGPQPLIYDPVQANIMTSKGRTTTLQVFFDDSMLNAGTTNSGASATQPIAFDSSYDLFWYPDLFRQANVDNNPNDVSYDTMQSFYSDMIEFDVSSVANLPTFDNGVTAKRIYLSGDNMAVSDAPALGNTPGNFAMLTTLGEADGSIVNQPQPPVTLPDGTTVTFEGTYNLLAFNPSNPSLGSLADISSLLGVWRPYTDVIANPSKFEIFTLPNSYESAQQQMAVVVRNAAGTITNFYWGTLDLKAKTFVVYPIADVVLGLAKGQLSGTVTSLLDKTGASVPSANTTAAVASVRSGQLQFTAPAALPAGFPALKAATRFLVIRA
jgi:hypothetical protein